MPKNRYFVTGSSGFIGTNIMEHLIGNNEIVAGYDIKKPRVPQHSDFFIQGSLVDKNKLQSALNHFKPTHIIHMGARTDLNSNNLADYSSNTIGVKNLIECCDELSSLTRVIFASSRLVCEIGYLPKNYEDYCPTTTYGESKVEGERLVKSLPTKSWDWCIVRPTSIWGEWFDVPYRNFFDLIRSRRYFHPAGIKVKKSFGYVGNVVHEVLALANADASKVSGRCFYVGDYAEIEVSDFAKKIALEFNVSKPVEVPYGLLRLAARIGDLLLNYKIKFPLTTFRLNNLVTPMPHNFEDLKAVVGELPFSVEDGIRLTVNWMKKPSNV